MKKLVLSFLIISTVLASVSCSVKDNNKDDIKNSTSIPAVSIDQNMKGVLEKMDLNSYVLKVLPTYEIGKYTYLLNSDYKNYNGVTQTLAYQGATIAKANPDGSRSSHCVGLTFEVFFRAMQERNNEMGLPEDNFNNMTADDMKDFLLTWYAALGTPKSEGDQLASAIVKYGLGTQITNLEDVKEGDFIDFSRTNNSGHAAVFINWIKDNAGEIIGFKYWSTQTSTNGINYKEEYFSDNSPENIKGLVDSSQLYIGRVGAVTSYCAFK
jgi:hypothetical protein